jgi:hypothetical protein
LGCCAAQQISISSAVQQQQQFLQICKIEHLWRSWELREGDKQTNKHTKTKTKNNTSSKQKQLNFIQFPHKKYNTFWYLLITYKTKFLDNLFWWVVLELGYSVWGWCNNNCLPTNQASGKSWAT